MNFWAFNNYYLSQDKHIIELTSSRKVSISKEDKIIFFTKSYNGLVFKSHGNVSSTSPEDLGEKGFQFRAEISDYELLDEARRLEDFAYSLEKIYRYKKPSLHFRRPYIQLTKDDFNTLIDARIYWARTNFGLFINQLPEAHIFRFLSQLAETDPHVLLQRTGYVMLWKSLQNFINQEYLSAAYIFEGIRQLIDKIDESTEIKIDYSKIGISSDDEKDTPDSIKEQERRFSQFLNLFIDKESQINLFQEIESRLERENKENEAFENIFRGTSWPIQMPKS